MCYPDYLQDTRSHRESITDAYEVARTMGLGRIHDMRSIRIDGGNTVHGGMKVILTCKIYGHTDGIMRFVDDDTLIMTNYSQWDRQMAQRFRKCQEPHFKTIHELHFNVVKAYKNNWAYINWLQTDKVLILPKFNVYEDVQAFEQIHDTCLNMPAG